MLQLVSLQLHQRYRKQRLVKVGPNVTSMFWFYILSLKFEPVAKIPAALVVFKQVNSHRWGKEVSLDQGK